LNCEGLRSCYCGAVAACGVVLDMGFFLASLYGVFLALDVRMLSYVLAASVLVGIATVLGMRKLVRPGQMVFPFMAAFAINFMVLWLIFDLFLGYPLLRVQSVFPIP